MEQTETAILNHIEININEMQKRLIKSSFGMTNFKEFPTSYYGEKIIVVITNANNPTITLFNAAGLDVWNCRKLVEVYSNYITCGCNYKYKIVSTIGTNVFFLN